MFIWWYIYMCVCEMLDVFIIQCDNLFSRKKRRREKKKNTKKEKTHVKEEKKNIETKVLDCFDLQTK